MAVNDVNQHECIIRIQFIHVVLKTPLNSLTPRGAANPGCGRLSGGLRHRFMFEGGPQGHVWFING